MLNVISQLQHTHTTTHTLALTLQWKLIWPNLNVIHFPLFQTAWYLRIAQSQQTFVRVCTSFPVPMCIGAITVITLFEFSQTAKHSHSGTWELSRIVSRT